MFDNRRLTIANEFHKASFHVVFIHTFLKHVPNVCYMEHTQCLQNYKNQKVCSISCSYTSLPTSWKKTQESTPLMQFPSIWFCYLVIMCTLQPLNSSMWSFISLCAHTWEPCSYYIYVKKYCHPWTMRQLSFIGLWFQR